MNISRRAALKSGLLGGLAGGLGACATADGLGSRAELTGLSFKHGVASGEPAVDGFLIWTRVSLAEGANGYVPVRYEVADDPDFTQIAARGKVRTHATRDYTVKADVVALRPGRIYYYRFLAGAERSPVGRCKTLPQEAIESVRFAAVSCSNYAFGFFNVYDAIAKRDDLDAVIHLGDYIYEYGVDGYGGSVAETIGRQHEPAHEIITLNDYRQRHAQYKSDPGSIAMHAAHALIPIWDDHETTNNSWENGAENHNLGEGDWDVRRAAALRAYYEWMPVREPDSSGSREALLRSFQWGDLVTVATLETRLMARSEQLDYEILGPTLSTPEGLEQFKSVDLVDESRELLGRPQLDRLTETLGDSVLSGTKWRVLANQIIMAEVTAPNLSPIASSPAIAEIEKVFPPIRDFIALSTLDIPLNLDAWDGYPAARERFYEMLRTVGATDLIVLTGDTHEWWANELRDQEGRSMGVELGTNAVTSPGASTYFGPEGATYSKLLNERNRMVHHHDPDGKGYIDLTLTRSGATANFVAVNNILSTDYQTRTQASFAIEPRGGSVLLSRQDA